MHQPGLLIALLAAVRASTLPATWLYPLWWAAVIVLPFRLRAGAVLLAVATASFLYVVPANHVWWGLMVAMTFALFVDDAQRRFVLRWQLTSLYLFTGLSKVSADWLTGDHLDGLMFLKHGLVLPTWLLVVMAVAAAVTELSLAALVWLPRWRTPMLVVAGAAHLTFWLALGPPLTTAPALLFYNGLAFAMLAYATWRPSGRRDPRRHAVGA